MFLSYVHLQLLMIIIFIINNKSVFGNIDDHDDDDDDVVTSNNIDNNIIFNTVYTNYDNKLDLLEQFSNWSCVNNASCIKAIAGVVLKRLDARKSINIGVIKIESNDRFVQKRFGGSGSVSGSEDGRRLINKNQTVLERLMNTNVLKIPIGPMMFQLEKSPKYNNYMELSLLKKNSNVLGQATMRKNNNENVARGKGGGFGGGGFGIKEKKHLQILIPLFLAMNSIGWTMLAMKIVSLLTVKAFLIAKIALVIAIGNLVRKFMDNAGQKMFPMHQHHYETHSEPQMVMPYNMEYSIPAAAATHSFQTAGTTGAGIAAIGGGVGGGNDLGTNDLYTLHMAATHDGHSAIIPAAYDPLSTTTGGGGGVGIGGGGNPFGAESQLHPQIVNITQAQQLQQLKQLQQAAAAAAAAASAASKINKRRQDRNVWTGIQTMAKPLIYANYLPNHPAYVYKQ